MQVKLLVQRAAALVQPGEVEQAEAVQQAAVLRAAGRLVLALAIRGLQWGHKREVLQAASPFMEQQKPQQVGKALFMVGATWRAAAQAQPPLAV